MPLIRSLFEQGTTNLNKLRFGDPDLGDRPGGGWSKQPFITTPGSDVMDLPTEGLSNTGGPDMFLRGGYLTPGNVLDDERRLLKLFKDTARGNLFTPQQNLLSTLGVRIYGGYPLGVKAANAFRLNDGTYLPTSTLAGAAGIAFGGHPNKQGIDFTGKSDRFSRPQYLNLIKGGIINTGGLNGISAINNNRLVNLYNTKLSKDGSLLGNIRNILGNVIPLSPDTLYSYLGGPGSDKDGLGRTYIKASGDSTILQNGGQILKGYNKDLSLKYSTLSQDQLGLLEPQSKLTTALNLSQNTFVVGDGTNTLVPDFRKNLENRPTSFISDSPNYLTQNIEKRVNLGNPGARGVDRSNYTTSLPSGKEGLDKINSLYMYKRSEVVSTKDNPINDLVKFRIAVIDNDNPSEKTFVHFRSFIESFQDSNQADWSGFKYLGRGENFYNYQGFDRTITMNFKVAAQSKPELAIMYQKLNYLMSSLSPDYSKGGYMRGNLVQMTVGGYLYEVPGIIQSLTYTIPNESPWEIGITSDGSFDSSVKELPLVVEASLQFKPIYNFLPQIVGSSYSKSNNPEGIFGGGSIDQRFISLEDAGKNINNLYNDGIKPQFKAKFSITSNTDE